MKPLSRNSVSNPFEPKFKEVIYPKSFVFKESKIELLYQQLKYGKKKLLYLISFCIIFSIIIIFLNTLLVQGNDSNYFLSTNEIISQNTIPFCLFIACISVEILIFFIPKIHNFKGMFASLLPLLSIIYQSIISYNKESKNESSMNTLNFICQIINIIAISFFYSNNWICGGITTFISYISLVIYMPIMNRSKYYEMIVCLIILTLGEIIIFLMIYLFENSYRKSFFRRHISEIKSDKYEQIVYKNPDPILIASNGKVISTNESYDKLFNRAIKDHSENFNNNSLNSIEEEKTSSIIEEPNILSLIINPINNKSFLSIIQESDQPLENSRFKLSKSNHSSTLNFELTSFLIKPSFNETNCITYFLRNITNSVETQKRKSQVHLNKLNLYMNSVTHDFRTPLGIIDGNIEEIIANYSQDQALMHNIRNIKKSSSILTLLVQDILDAASINENRLTLKYTQFNIYNLVEEMKDIFLIKFMDKDLYLETKFNSEIPSIIYSDEGRIKQIFFNLLSNAYKFTINGGVTINASYNPLLNEIQIDIVDTGVGISTEKLNLLFNPYQKLDEHSSLNPNGIGLGLYNCKNLIEKLLGKISVMSIPGEGSTFTFTFKNIPQANDFKSDSLCFMNIAKFGELVPSISENIDSEGVSNDPNLQRDFQKSFEFILSHNLSKIKTKKFCSCPKILIVDDDESCRSVYKFYLNQYHINYIEGRNGKEAIDIVTNFFQRECCKYFKVILIDHNMPIMTGIDASIKIHKFHMLNSIFNSQIILASGDNSQIDIQIENIFSKVIIKPISSKDFKEVIMKFLLI